MNKARSAVKQLGETYAERLQRLHGALLGRSAQQRTSEADSDASAIFDQCDQLPSPLREQLFALRVAQQVALLTAAEDLGTEGRTLSLLRGDFFEGQVERRAA